MSKAKPELKLVEDTGSQLQDEDLSIELPPQQSEMPFAVVEGEPMTQLPRDLYIPPDALQVFLTAFEGPLDLLLYLIRKQNLDILNIPIAEITRQYMQYIDVMAEMQLELAGEYLLMAAMLAEIKSRMLLPRPATAEGTDEDDPRAELVRRLQEYERFKKAAEDLDKLNRLERDNISTSAELEERKVVKLLPDVTLKEMLDAFRDVLSRAEKFAHHHISRERLSQRERMTEILARLQTVAFFEFRQLFKPEEGRMGVTVTFIAILELMKEGLIEIVQAEAYAPIHVRTAQRHLKVVQGGQAASETADAENAAALAQPELAGENDIPDEDDTPPADEAAVAVEAAVADVAAASSIAADSVESDQAIADTGFVEAVVSEAIASTETALETVAEVAATSEEAVAAAVAEEVAAGSPVVIDEESSAVVQEIAIDAAVIEAAAVELTGQDLTVNSHVYDEVTLEDVPHELGAVDPVVADETDPLEARIDEPVIEQVAELSVSPVFDVLSQDVSAHAAVIEGTVVTAPASIEALASIYTPESVGPSDAVAPPDAISPTDALASPDAVASTDAVAQSDAVEPTDAVAPTDAVVAVESIDAVVAVEEHTVEEHVVEEHEVEEHIVPEHVVEEHIVPDPVIDETTSLAATTEVAEDALVATAEVAQEIQSEPAEVVADIEPTPAVEEPAAQAQAAEVVDEHVADVEPTLVVEEPAAQAKPAEIADEPVASADLTATELVDQDSQSVATTDAVVTEAVAPIEAVDVEDSQPVLEAIEVAAEDLSSSEPVEVVAEVEPAVDPIEVVADDAPSDELTNVVIDDAAAGHDEATSEQNADLSGPDVSNTGDSVTGASDEADNSDAEPTR